MAMLKVDEKRKRIRAHFQMTESEIRDYMNKKFIVSIRTPYGSNDYYPVRDKYENQEANGQKTE